MSRLVYRKGADFLAVIIPEICARHPSVTFIIGQSIAVLYSKLIILTLNPNDMNNCLLSVIFQFSEVLFLSVPDVYIAQCN